MNEASARMECLCYSLLYNKQETLLQFQNTYSPRVTFGTVSLHPQKAISF
jgi:hypothetical protein